MTKTREEIDRLKESWLKDPCWDIEDTPGFEEHGDDLLAYRKEQEVKWEQKALDRKAKRGAKVGAWTGIYDIDMAQYLSTFDEIENELRRLEDQNGDAGSATEWYQFVISREQVRATLLLAAQVKRVADLLGQQIDEAHGEHQQEFMTKLYKVD